ncbi:unnamed protein product [Tetraodon nigroviridis]|uniref:(spotted green pufferfish) hypothetical protein n=1 Tax=Tetraodon nigroviridis TaxID=99883 RepID=Q4S1U2_TETNG|nr:unnamed protein product [Tetraodon nigroviridis]
MQDCNDLRRPDDNIYTYSPFKEPMCLPRACRFPAVSRLVPWKPPKLCSSSPGHHPHLHGPADQRRHCQPQGKQAKERLRLPLGPVLGGCPDGCVLLYGSALVRGSYGHLHRTHRLSEDGEREQRPWGAAAVPWSQGTEADGDPGVCPDWTVSLPRSHSSVHSYAGPLRSLPLHGCGLAGWHPGSRVSLSSVIYLQLVLINQKSAIFNDQHQLISPGPVLGAHQALPDATQTPARLLLSAPRASAAGPPVHPRPAGLLGCPLDPQIHLPRHHLPSNVLLRRHCSTLTTVSLRPSLSRFVLFNPSSACPVRQGG